LSPSWQFSTRVENLTSKVYADRAAISFSTYQYFPGRPRALFLEIAYRKDRAQ
jgi:hypothetical protein